MVRYEGWSLGSGWSFTLSRFLFPDFYQIYISCHLAVSMNSTATGMCSGQKIYIIFFLHLYSIDNVNIIKFESCLNVEWPIPYLIS